MQYGFALVTLAALLAGYGGYRGGYWWLLLWPALNFLIVGWHYFQKSPTVFGKQSDGTLPIGTKIWLFPFLALQHVAWTLARWFSKENKFDRLDDRTIIGRRLLPKELPDDVANVIDLTAEFEEPTGIRAERNYVSFPILDASEPTVDGLESLVEKIDALDGKSFIHCAQGHGRTGLITAALMMHRDSELTVESAMEALKEVRPKLECNPDQIKFLKRYRDARDEQHDDA